MTIFCASAFASAQSPCPDTPQWKDLTAAQRRGLITPSFAKQTQSLSDDCFLQSVSSLHSADKKLTEDSLTAIFSSRAAKGNFSQDLFISLFKTNHILRNRQLWSKITDIWSSASAMPVYAVLASHSEGGKLPVADTLYRALDAAERLDAHERLRFGRVKSLLGDYRAAAAVYCGVIAGDKRLEHAALTQMSQLFADADSAAMVAAMDDFEKCVFGLPESDTVFLRNWLADFYGRSGLFEKEIEALSRFGAHLSSSGRKLADAAKTHFARRRYRHAANAAAAAHTRLDDKDPREKGMRSDNAFIAHQAYMQLGKRDSALVWLKLSEVSNRDAKVQSAALSQEAGHIREAAALIDSLPASLSKDTLTVRQHIFSGELGKALSHTSSPLSSWIMNPKERMFWQARVLIFNGRPHDAAPVMDSIKFAPAWHGTAEILRYKYWIQKLEDDQPALDTWGKLEHLIYTGDLPSAVQTLKKHGMSGEPGEMMAVRLAAALAKSARYQEALEILDLADDAVGATAPGRPPLDNGRDGYKGVDYGIKGIDRGEDKKTKPARARTPEYLYLRAEMLHETGRRDEARVAAQKILKDFPGDVFAQKARILLTRI